MLLPSADDRKAMATEPKNARKLGNPDDSAVTAKLSAAPLSFRIVAVLPARTPTLSAMLPNPSSVMTLPDARLKVSIIAP